MSHNLEMIDGTASFFANNVPAWHNLGVVVDGAQTWEEAIKLARMDYTVSKHNLLNPFTQEPIADVFGIFRDDNHTMLGTVGSRYETIQNEFMFSFMDSVLDADGKAHYETAGVLGLGERIFVVANLSTEHDVLGSGDKHKAYLVGVGSHDGSMSQRFFTSDVRVVCNNTLNIALSKAKGSGVSVRHTANAEARLNSKLQDLKAFRDGFFTTMEKLDFLAQRKINTRDFTEITNELFGIDSYEDASTRKKNSIEVVRMLLEQNDKNAFPEFRGTAYNLLNAVTEYNDHYKEVRRTSGRGMVAEEVLRSDNTMFGTSSDDKSNALDVILKKCENNATINGSKSYSMSNAGVLDSIISRM